MSSNSITKLLVAALTFVTLNPLSLDAMERAQEPSVYTVANQGISGGIDEIVQNDKCPSKFIDAILRVSSVCEPDLAAEFVSTALSQAGVSLFDIRYSFGWTPLHYSVACDATNATKILLIVASKHGDDKLREFICMKDNFGHTALYSSNCSQDAVKELCAVTDKCYKDKGWTLLCEGDNKGDTVVHYAADCGCLKLVKALVAYVETLREGKVWELCMKKNYAGFTAWDCASQDSAQHRKIRRIIQKHRPIDMTLCLVKFCG